MAIEARRGCGYRKVGGLYLMGSGSGCPCDRLPLPLTVCPCCSAGFTPTRGWTWVDVNLLVDGIHRNCMDSFPCPLCMATPDMGKAGLLWIGTQFYPNPASFTQEAERLGISRRISAVPRNFKVGETWVLLAHSQAATCPACKGSGLKAEPPTDQPVDVMDVLKVACGCKKGKTNGVFRVFRPHAIEKIVTETQSRDLDAMADLERRGITPVVVPDDDKDHQGTVYDEDDASEEAGK